MSEKTLAALHKRLRRLRSRKCCSLLLLLATTASVGPWNWPRRIGSGQSWSQRSPILAGWKTDSSGALFLSGCARTNRRARSGAISRAPDANRPGATVGGLDQNSGNKWLKESKRAGQKLHYMLSASVARQVRTTIVAPAKPRVTPPTDGIPRAAQAKCPTSIHRSLRCRGCSRKGARRSVADARRRREGSAGSRLHAGLDPRRSRLVDDGTYAKRCRTLSGRAT